MKSGFAALEARLNAGKGKPSKIAAGGGKINEAKALGKKGTK